MAASSRGGSAFSALIKGPPRICSQCARRTSRFQPSSQRSYSATAVETSTTAPPPETPSTPGTTTAPRPWTHHAPNTHKIRSGIILSRPPLLTRPLTAFESAFFLYQKRLNERLAAPFRKPLYFKPDTAAELDWRLKVRDRKGTVAKDVGVYNGKGRHAWNDEVLAGSALAAEDSVRARLLRDAEVRISEDGEEVPDQDRIRPEPPTPRLTDADERGDATRLDRALDRTLYLVVRGEEGWGFPKGDVRTDENLHETAMRVLASAAGVNMNTWIVGRVPVAHLVTDPVLGEDSAVETKGEKVFFLKGRIMAGQADLAGNTLGLTEFKWLTRDELKKELPPSYYHGVRNAIVGR